MPWGKLLKIESRRYTRLKITLLDTTRNLAWPDWNLCFSCFWTRLNFGFLTQLYLWMAPCSRTTTLAPKRTYPTHPLLEVRAPIAALFGEQGHLLQIAIEYIYIYVCLFVLIYWKVNQLGSWCLKRKCVLLFVCWKVSTQWFLRTTFPVVFTKAPTTQLFWGTWSFTFSNLVGILTIPGSVNPPMSMAVWMLKI